jgi:hypothetical protein
MLPASLFRGFLHTFHRAEEVLFHRPHRVLHNSVEKAVHSDHECSKLV